MPKLPQYKINRGYIYAKTGCCPVILQDRLGYDTGTCAEGLDEKGNCPKHGNAVENASKPIPPEHAAQLVWFVRDNVWESQDKKTLQHSERNHEIVASAQMYELIANGLINEQRVITPKGELLMTDFVKYSHPTPDKVLYLELKRPGLRVTIW